MRARATALFVGFIAGVCGPATSGSAQEKADAPPNVVSSSIGDLRLERLATLEYPWGMALLPDGRLLITEKPGRLRIWNDGKLSEPIGGIPEVVYRGPPKEQGGLLDVEIDPDFKENQFVYLSFSEAADEQSEAVVDTDDYRLGSVDQSDTIIRGGAVARGRLDGSELRDVEVIWRQSPKTVGRGHFGNRMVFAKDGTLFITSGERMRFDPAQSLSSNLGKVVRIKPDGSIPNDNPFADKKDARGEIWSYGHRNILAAAIDPDTDRLWTFEMGPLGGDEVNLIKRGRNYGWPLVSNGDHYGREGVTTEHTSIPGHATSKEFEPPVRTWTPVVSPSGAVFYTGDVFPKWRGSAFVGGLSSMALVRLEFDEERVALEERIDMQRRIRDVLQAPDGALLVIVDAKDGDLFRIMPAKSR